MSKKEIKIRLTGDELAYLNSNVAKTGLSREQYLRLLITDRVPVTLPPADYKVVARQLNRLEEEIRSVAAIPLSEDDHFRLMTAVQTVHSTALMMQKAVLPQVVPSFILQKSEVRASA